MAIRFELLKKGLYYDILKIEDDSVTIASDDPSSPNYNNAIDGKKNPLEIFNSMRGKYPVSTNGGVFTSPVIIEQVAVRSGVTVQKNNTFVAGDIIHKRDNDVYGLSSLSKLSDFGSYLVIAASATQFTYIFEQGIYSWTAHNLGSSGTILWINPTTGSRLTSTEPALTQYYIPLVRVYDADRIEYFPALEIKRRN